MGNKSPTKSMSEVKISDYSRHKSLEEVSDGAEDGGKQLIERLEAIPDGEKVRHGCVLNLPKANLLIL
jgi:hypothetical protein